MKIAIEKAVVNRPSIFRLEVSLGLPAGNGHIEHWYNSIIIFDYYSSFFANVLFLPSKKYNAVEFNFISNIVSIIKFECHDKNIYA